MVIRISKTSLLSFSLLLVLLTSSDVLAASGLDHAEGISDDSILCKCLRRWKSQGKGGGKGKSINSQKSENSDCAFEPKPDSNLPFTFSTDYKPSQIGSLVFAMLYFSTSLLLFINVYSWRDWWAHCLPIGSLVSTAGYIIRGFVLRGNPGSLPAYISQDLFIVLAPAAFLAFNYASFGRIATAIAGFYGTEKKNVNLTLINPKRMGVYFVCSDVATFLIQAWVEKIEEENIPLGNDKVQSRRFLRVWCRLALHWRSISSFSFFWTLKQIWWCNANLSESQRHWSEDLSLWWESLCLRAETSSFQTRAFWPDTFPFQLRSKTGIIAQFVSYVIFLFLVIRCHHLCKSIHATSQTSLGVSFASCIGLFLLLALSWTPKSSFNDDTNWDSHTNRAPKLNFLCPFPLIRPESPSHRSTRPSWFSTSPHFGSSLDQPIGL